MKRNLPNQRDVFAHAVVVSGLFFGASSFFLVPLIIERNDARSELEAIHSQTAQTVDTAALSAAIRAELEQAERYERAIADRSAHARDELALYEVYRQLAAELGVTIDRFNPKPLNAPAPRQTGRKKGPKQIQPDFGVSVRVDATGTLASVTRLIDALSRQAGFVTVRSARITPNGEAGTDGVLLSLETEHYSYTVPDPATLAASESALAEGGR